MVVSFIDNGTQDRVTLTANTSAEIWPAEADRSRTAYIVTTAACHIALGRVATTDDLAMLADDAIYLNVPAGKSVNAISAGTPSINIAEIKFNA